jgi:hypothetical protein
MFTMRHVSSSLVLLSLSSTFKEIVLRFLPLATTTRLERKMKTLLTRTVEFMFMLTLFAAVWFGMVVF